MSLDRHAVGHTPESTDEVFFLLGEQRRRDLLGILISSTSPVRVEDLAAQLSAVGGAPDDHRLEGITTQLCHVDLPKLDDAGLVCYDSEHRVVAFESLAADTRAVIDSARDALDAVAADL